MSTRGSAALCDAAASGQCERVLELLGDGVPIDGTANRAGRQHWTPLFFAVWYRQTTVAKLLINHGAKLDFNNLSWRDGPTHLAAQRGEADILRALLRKGADANLRAQGSTPLHEAAKAKHLACAKLLLVHGADPKAKDADGHYPQYYARKEMRGGRGQWSAECRSSDLVRWLEADPVTFSQLLDDERAAEAARAAAEESMSFADAAAAAGGSPPASQPPFAPHPHRYTRDGRGSAQAATASAVSPPPQVSPPQLARQPANRQIEVDPEEEAFAYTLALSRVTHEGELEAEAVAAVAAAVAAEAADEEDSAAAAAAARPSKRPRLGPREEVECIDLTEDTPPGSPVDAPDEEITCPVCWESLKEQKDTAAGVKMLGCGHTFCSGCIGEHIRTQAAARVAVTCPMCRYNIPASERA